MNRRALIRADDSGISPSLFDFIALYGNLAAQIHFALADLRRSNQIKHSVSGAATGNGEGCTRRDLSRRPQFGCLCKRHTQGKNQQRCKPCAHITSCSSGSNSPPRGRSELSQLRHRADLRRRQLESEATIPDPDTRLKPISPCRSRHSKKPPREE